METTVEEEVMKDEPLMFDLLEKKDLEEEVNGQRMISLNVETKVGDLEGFPGDLEKITAARTTKRGTRIYGGGFKYNKETGILSLEIATPIPEYYPEIPSQLVGTTFADFCWLLSTGTTAQNVGQVSTPFNAAAEYGDLTWLVPAKFCDDVVEMMNILNNFILEGNLFQAIMYGPIYI
jgi:hypothetical protein